MLTFPLRDDLESLKSVQFEVKSVECYSKSVEFGVKIVYKEQKLD